jgi:cytosine/adenosine deaminase-related metal-dependent hydrolase
MAADFIAVNLDQPSFAGALHDPLAALLFCNVNKVDYSFINGRRVIDQGIMTTIDLPRLVSAHNAAARQLVMEAKS